MTTCIHRALGGTRRAERLLKSWHDIQQAILMLSTRLALIPDNCTCGRAGAHITGECACCVVRDRESAEHCGDCDALLDTIERQIDALVVDTMRFLPPVSPSVSTGSERARTDDLRRQVEMVAGVVGRLRTAAAEYMHTRRTSSLDALKQRTQELFRVGRRLNEMLENSMGGSDDTSPRSSR